MPAAIKVEYGREAQLDAAVWQSLQRLVDLRPATGSFAADNNDEAFHSQANL